MGVKAERKYVDEIGTCRQKVTERRDRRRSIVGRPEEPLRTSTCRPKVNGTMSADIFKRKMAHAIQ
jgi:hypothetical protein